MTSYFSKGMSYILPHTTDSFVLVLRSFMIRSTSLNRWRFVACSRWQRFLKSSSLGRSFVIDTMKSRSAIRRSSTLPAEIARCIRYLCFSRCSPHMYSMPLKPKLAMYLLNQSSSVSFLSRRA